MRAVRCIAYLDPAGSGRFQVNMIVPDGSGCNVFHPVIAEGPDQIRINFRRDHIHTSASLTKRYIIQIRRIGAEYQLYPQLFSVFIKQSLLVKGSAVINRNLHVSPFFCAAISA